MQSHQNDEQSPPKEGHDAPPIWWQHRDRPPSRRINHAVVTINGKRVDRINRPEVMALDKEAIAERFPSLYGPGQHEIRLDFRSDVGRGSLAHIQFTEGDKELEQPSAAPTSRRMEAEVLEFTNRVMMQNERLHKQLLEATVHNAQTTVDSHERLVTMLSSSMERDRQRQNDWMEREAALRQGSFERQLAAGQSNNEQQRAIMEMIAPLLMSSGGGGGLGEVQDAITEKITESLMEKVDSIGASVGDRSPLENIIESVGPILAQKLMPGGETPPTG